MMNIKHVLSTYRKLSRGKVEERNSPLRLHLMQDNEAIAFDWFSSTLQELPDPKYTPPMSVWLSSTVDVPGRKPYHV